MLQIANDILGPSIFSYLLPYYLTGSVAQLLE